MVRLESRLREDLKQLAERVARVEHSQAKLEGLLGGQLGMGGAVENFALFGDQTGDWVSTIPRGIRRSFWPKDGGINPLGASGKGIPQGNLRKTGIVSSVCPPTGWAKRSRMMPPLQPFDAWSASHRTLRIERFSGPIRALPATHSETRKSDGIRISAMRISS